MPVRVREVVVGLELPVTVTFPDRLPVLVGVKVTLIVQLEPAATLDPQLLVCAKSPALLPPTVTLVIVRGAAPELVSVTGTGTLVVPTPWLAKA